MPMGHTKESHPASSLLSWASTFRRLASQAALPQPLMEDATAHGRTMPSSIQLYHLTKKAS